MDYESSLTCCGGEKAESIHLSTSPAKLCMSQKNGNFQKGVCKHRAMDSKGKYTARFYDDEGGGSVIGANAMMGHNVFFDVDGQRIGWAESSCDYSELLSSNGYGSVMDAVDVASETEREDETDGKKPKPSSGSDHDQESPPADVTQALSDLADACDSLACQGGVVTFLTVLLLCCVCLLRCCCCPSKKYSEPSYQRAEVEMNGISSSYRDEDGLKDEPDDEDEEFGEFNPDP